MDIFSTPFATKAKDYSSFQKRSCWSYCLITALLFLLGIPVAWTQIQVTNCPPDRTVDCVHNVLPEPHLFIVESSCSINNEINVIGPQVLGTPNCPSTQYTFTYTITDDCGQVGICQQTYLLENEPPELIVPNEICVIECPEDPAMIVNSFNNFAANAVVNTSCIGLDPVITNNFDPNNFNSVDCSTSVFAIPNVRQAQVVTFIATDLCGRTSTGEMLILVVDNTPPTIEGEPYLTIRECDDLIQSEYDAWIADNLSNLTATDACGEVTWSYSPASPNEGPWINGYAITHVVFTATDECGNEASKDIHFKLKNNLPPTWVGTLEDLTVDCADPIPSFTTPEFVNSCGTTTLTFEDVTTPGDCLNEFSITRTWTVTDNCEGINTTAQTLFVVDTTPPVAPPAPEDIAVQCEEDIPAPVNLTAMDDCAGEITASPSAEITPGDCANQFVMVRTWIFEDGCGNSVSVSQTITVNDTTAPEAPAAPADLSLACANEIPPAESLTAMDNCDGSIEVDAQIQILPQNCPNKFTEIRTWVFEDECGNSTSISQTIVVNDSIPPLAINVPEDKVISCEEPVEFGPAPTWEDNCGGPIGPMSFEDNTIPGDCPNEFSITRTWSVVDDCGILGTASQTITVIDETAPDFTTVPPTQIVECGETPVFETPTAEDNCGAVELTFEDLSTPAPSCEEAVTWIRLWTATDECGNSAQLQTEILILPDTTAPVFTFVPPTPDVDCDSIPDWEVPTVEDNCGAVNLTFTETISGDLCLDGYAWKRLWTATDECGNTAQVETVIWVNPDIEGPVFTYVPPTPDVDCDNIPDWELPIAEDACGEVTLTFTESISGDLCIDGYAWKRLWTATDECGNTAQVETVIWVNPDKEGPVFTFVPEGDLIGCDEFPPTFGEPEVEDACGNVTLTFFDQFIGNPNGCEEGENFDYERWWIATDECGNETTAKQTFWVKPDQTIMGTVSGQLLTESAEWIEAAEVSVEGNGSNWTNSLVTDEEGTYDFVLPLDHNYSIIPQRNDDLRNGVSTMDLILMSKHILGMELLDSPYKIIAADINNSGTVTAFDLVELSKVILHISDEFSNNQSWRFIDESYVFVDPTHPFGSTFPERHDINGLSGEVVADFIGVKVGDVNGSAQANSLQEGDTRNANKKLHFTLEDRQLQAGETYTIDFKASDFQSILGYQFTLQFSTADLGFIDWQGGVLPGLSMRNFGWGKLEEGYIMGNWYHEKAWSVEEDETLFQMTFQAINTVRLSEVISLNPQYTAVEAYDAFTERMDLGLKFTQLKEGEQAYPFQLLQNHPNPFKQSTQVRFLLPEASNVTFTVYDLAGQVLQEMTGDFVKGYNEITIDRSQISGSGVLYYRLETPSRSATKRMIMLHD